MSSNTLHVACRRVVGCLALCAMAGGLGRAARADTTTAPAAPAIDASTPQGQWLAFERDAIAGDPKKLEIYYKATTKAGQAILPVMLKADFVSVQLDQAIEKKFGRSVADKMLRAQHQFTDADVATAEVSINKDAAVIKVKDVVPAEMKLVRQGKTWATDVDEDAEKTGAETMEYCQRKAKLLGELKTDLEAGKFTDAAALYKAVVKIVEKLDAPLGASTIPATAPETAPEK